jgi:hypothetical protein
MKISTALACVPLANISKTAINSKNCSIEQKLQKNKFISAKFYKSMPKKKISKHDDDVIEKKKVSKDPSDEESLGGEDSTIDPAIIEDTFTEEFSEYNDVDNF